MEPNRQASSCESFYHLQDLPPGAACHGLACFVARHLNPQRFHRPANQDRRIHCLGQCFQGPACVGDETRPHIEAHCATPVVLERVHRGGVRELNGYKGLGGFAALKRALFEGTEWVLDRMDASHLRGRGGAGFPVGKKWRAVADQPAGAKYVVANADEGDPGAYIDRYLMEDDPFCLIEAMTLAGFTIGAQKGFIYLRAEYPQARNSLEAALAEAHAAGWLGPSIDHTSFAFEIELVQGHGSYVCGEETAMLNSIEGRRPEVRCRPPYPTECGLFGKPTLVNNVETLASVPWIIREGSARYHAMGFSQSRGTKVLSLNSLFRKPGLYEVEFGVKLQTIVEDCGGGLHSGELRGIIVGAPLAGIIPPHLLDVRFGFEELRAIGASVGHGGVVAFDQHTSVLELMHHVFSFSAYESCGKCTPCREGAFRAAEFLACKMAGDALTSGDEREFGDIVAALAQTSLCGLGTGLADFARSALRHYAEEVAPCCA